MKKIILIWQVPTLSGVPYAPLMALLYKPAAEKFQKNANSFFKEEGLNYEVVLDSTSADIKSLLEEDAEMFLFAPGAESRSWMYKEELKQLKAPIYFLDAMEYYNTDIKKILKETKIL